MKTILAVVLLFSSLPALAETERECLSNCIGKGNTFKYCRVQCSPEKNQGQVQSSSDEVGGRVPHTDFNCMNACTAKSTNVQYCHEHCTH